MLEVDNPPVVLFCLVMLALVAPLCYSFFVDKFDKKNPQIKS